MAEDDELNKIVLHLPKPITLNKYLHYGSAYRPNDLYWVSALKESST